MKKLFKSFLCIALVLAMVLTTPLATFANDNVTGSQESIENALVKNSTTGTTYDEIMTALEEASEGDIIALVQNASEFVLLIPENVILDLNGYTLEAEYVTCFGSIVDYSAENTGYLSVPENRFLIQENNKQLPVRDGEGYRFYDVTKFNTRYLDADAKYVFQPFIERNAHDIILKDKASTGVTINVRVSWKQNDGTRHQDFLYNDSYVEGFLNSYYVTNNVEKYRQMFTLVMSATENFDDITFTAIVASDTGVVIESGSTLVGGPVATEKFQKAETAKDAYSSGATVTLGEIFVANSGAEIDNANVQVTISGNGVSGTYKADTTDWTKGTITFNGTGLAQITITDNNNCVATTIYVEVAVFEKFLVAETAKESYTSGTVLNIGELFALTQDAPAVNSADVQVTVETVEGDVTGTYIADTTDWTSGTLTFNGVGKATVTIIDGEYCVPTVLTVEISEVKKFEKAYTVLTSFTTGTVIEIGDLFVAAEGATLDIIDADVSVVVKATEGDVTGVFEADTADWTKGKLSFNGVGTAEVTITDNNYCTAETVTVKIVTLQKFEKAETAKESYTTGTTVKLGELFTEVSGLTLGVKDSDVKVTVEGEGVSGTYTADTSDWTLGTLTFNGAGEATVTITDDNYCVETSILVEIFEIEKFEKAETAEETYTSGTKLNVGDLFTAIDGITLDIDSSNVQVSVTPVGEDSTVRGTYEANSSDWTQGTFKFNGTGKVEITITDNNSCIATTYVVEILPVQKFEKAETAGEAYSSGEEVTVGNLFAANESATLPIDSKNVTVTITAATRSNFVSGVFIGDPTDWTKGIIKFTGVGTAFVTITDNDCCVSTTITVDVKPIEKFEKADTALTLYHSGTKLNIGNLFAEIDGITVDVDNTNVQVTVAPVGDSDVTGTYVADTTDWTKGTLTFNGAGDAKVTITDYNCCLETTISVKIVEVQKFKKAYDAADSYPVGATVNLGDLFEVISGLTLPVKDLGVQITVTTVDGNVTGTYVADTADWTKGTLTFNGVGTAEVTITDNDYCIPTTITVGVNAIKKFEKADTAKESYTTGTTVNVGDLFVEKTGLTLGVNVATVNVTVEGEGVTGTYLADTTDWTKGTITFNGAGTATITITDNEYCVGTSITAEINTIKKFEKADTAKDFYTTGTTVNVGDLFAEISGLTLGVNDTTVIVTVEGEGVTGTYIADTSDWTKGTITLNGAGTATVTITDNDCCIATSIAVDVNAIEKFEKADTAKDSYAAGATVSVGELFTEKTGITLGVNDATVNVTVDGVAGTYNADAADWTKGTITFNGAGTATITITDNEYCIATTITVNVIASQKFEKADTAKESYTAGTTVKIGELFAEKADLDLDVNDATVSVTIEGVTGTYVADTTDWTKGTLTFNSVGTATITITDNNYCVATSITVNVLPVEKFLVSDTVADSYETETTVNVGDLFITNSAATLGIDSANVQVTVTGNGASGTYTANTTDWTKGTVAFTGVGRVVVTITDNNNCVAVSVELEITEPIPVTKFGLKFPNTSTYMYRVGNVGTVSASTLFEALDNVTIKTANISVTTENVKGDATVTYTANTSDWTKGTFQFNGNGIVKITITDNYYCIPTELVVEVVDAKNIIAVENATSNNVVLLGDSSGTFTVSNGYTFYGNGFKVYNTGNGSYRSPALSYAFINVENGGTLDNTQIICSVFPESYMFTNEMQVDSENRYPYAHSAVLLTGDSTISNCYIYGARNNILLSTGNATIKNTVLESGSLSNLQINSNSAYTITLEDVTTSQCQTTSTFDTSKRVLGFGIAVGSSDSDSNPTIKIEGEFTQYNWVTAADKTVSNVYAKQAISSALTETAFQKKINGETAINLGIVYLNTKAATVNNNSVDSETYILREVVINGLVGQAYSVAGDGASSPANYDATADGVIPYTPECNNNIPANVEYSDVNTALTLEKQYTGGVWEYKFSADLDNISGGSYTFSFNKLIVEKYGSNLNYVIKDSAGNTVNASTTITLSDLSSTEYTLTITNVPVYNAEGEVAYTVSQTYPLVVSATKTSIEPPKFTNEKTAKGIRLVDKAGGDWRPAYQALNGVTVTYWSSTERAVKTVDLSTIYSGGTIKSNVWTYTCADYTLTITGGAVHSDGTVITPVVADGTLWFASTNKAFTTGTTSRNIILTYVFTDNNDSTSWSRTESVAYGSLDEYDFSSFKNGTLTAPSSGGGCVAPETLVTLADGTQVRVDSLTGNEELLVWNLETGKLDTAPIMFIDSEPEAESEVVHLYFSDGTDVKVIYEHGFWDYDLNKYVYLDEKAADYIGHTFAKMSGDELVKVQLTDVVIETECTSALSPVTVGHLSYFVNGMLSMPGGIEGLFNIFDVDAETMTYDYDAMQKDIETYGLFTYDELNNIEPLSEEMFNAAGGAYLKVAIGKGILNMDDLAYMIRRYSAFI